MSQRSAPSAAAKATAEVSDPPRPSVVTRPSGDRPWKPGTIGTSPAAMAHAMAAVSMSTMRALACDPSVRIGICHDIQERDFTLENVQNYILHHAIRAESLDPYLFFSKGSYTRNLIFKNEVFECMAICWEVGQFSRIHNHRDQNCWMSAPIGRLRVQNFRVDERDVSRGTCHIVPTETYEMDAEHPAYVNPLEPVHQVLNLPEFKQRAVSIHVYSKPFDT